MYVERRICGERILHGFSEIEDGYRAEKRYSHQSRGIATELNNGYFRDGVGYLKEEEMKHNEPSLFDFINENAG